jgi:hypothetical protein
MPSDRSAKPARMMLLALRAPARRAARSATANMLSDSGASDSPAWSALYSRTIWRKIGSAIIAPPRASAGAAARDAEPEDGDRNRSGSIRASLPSRLRRTSHQPATPGDRADGDERADRLAALLPDQDAEHDAAHAEDREQAPPGRSSLARVGTSLTRPIPTGRRDDHELQQERRRATTGYVVMKPPMRGPIAAAIAARRRPARRPASAALPRSCRG